MDFIDCCKQLSDRVSKLKEQIATEEATKNAFIMPFIQMLGYDVFDPTEVIPEMDCDLIKKKGEKIDYAIMKDGEPIILVECKHWQQNLSLHDNQLQKYFVASKAKFGILTNGIIYRFYTDLVKENIMDNTPFLEINMESLRDSQIEELKKFHKSYFDIENILSTANELKYISELKKSVKEEFASPSPDFVRFFAKKAYEGIITQKILDQFTDILKRTIASHINDVISERLNVAMKSTDDLHKPIDSSDTDNLAVEEEVKQTHESKIVTTEEELEGFYIVKSIGRSILPSERITYRDVESYFSVLIDDNNRRPLCRLYFNTKQKQVGVFIDKVETKHKIDKLDDIYELKDEIIEAAKFYAE